MVKFPHSPILLLNKSVFSMATYCFCHCFLYPRTECIMKYGAVRKFYHDYLHYCGIFLARFLIKVDLNIISSLHIVFSLCARVVWCDVCTDFTNNKSRCRCKWDVTIEYLTHAIFEKQWQLCTCPYYYLLSSMCLFCRQKCGPRPKLFLGLDTFST